MRKLLGVAVGAAVAAGAIWLTGYVNHQIFSLAAFDPGDFDSIHAAIQAAPDSAKAMIAGGYFLGALTGGLIAVRIAGGWGWAGWIVAALVLAGGAAAALLVPQPLWMQIATGVAPLLGGLMVRNA
ncbi:hypothetical protein ACFQ1E_03895 [Sphingomonas canadensis]|uniref:DUF4345 domain-containing protein n=1 Tax=Sphingomonas canadensis TaxID=1219257 RepID=A0ABW3H1Y5_9SPHN|nr:hypothetical protein [Sphingomonas canadensis]MCW3834614.1 hypothetical protein [Sphingomonas canadensis]